MTTTTTAIANEQLVRQFFASFGSPEKDKTTMRSMCSADFLWENSGLPPVRGHDAACAMIDAWAAQLDFASLAIEMLHLAADGDTVLCERVDTFYNSKGETLFKLDIMGRLKIQAGKIVAYRDYFDPTEIAHKFAS